MEMEQDPNDPTSLNELLRLYSFIGSMDVPAQSLIGFHFMLNPDGRYFGNKLRRIIDSKLISFNGVVIPWLKTIPLKVHCFVWHASLSRIPVAMELSKKGIKIPNLACHLCNKTSEMVNHLLVNCEFTKGVYEWVFKWCGIKTQQLSTVCDFINFAALWGNCPKKRSIFFSILCCLWWNVWMERNDRIYKELRTSFTKIADMLSLSYLWCNHRSKEGCGSWTNWCCSPFSHLTIK